MFLSESMASVMIMAAIGDDVIVIICGDHAFPFYFFVCWVFCFCFFYFYFLFFFVCFQNTDCYNPEKIFTGLQNHFHALLRNLLSPVSTSIQHCPFFHLISGFLRKLHEKCLFFLYNSYHVS